jgi:hypothetical protein
MHDLRDVENREPRHSPSSITGESSSHGYGFPGSFFGRRQQKQQEKQRGHHHHPHVDESPASSLSPSPRRNSLSRPRRRAAAQTSTMDTTMIHNNSSSNLAAQHLHWRQDSCSDMSDNSRGSLNSAGVRRRNRSPTPGSSSHHSHASPTLFGLVHASTAGFSGGGSTAANVDGSQQQPPLPSLGVISSELLLICHVYVKYAALSFKQPCQRVRRIVKYFVGSVLAAAFLVAAWCALDFYRDATRICTPPPRAAYDFADHHPFAAGGNPPDTNYRPLVEYFIHGRGIGHYARSVAIVEELNKAGVDVRMFLSRAAMWRALHEEESSNKLVDGDEADPKNQKPRGTTTAISVASITPSMDMFSVLSHTMERIVGDCEVAANSNRYPSLIISDGDMPGMLRAKFGGIPSVGISHGQLFSIAQKPSWVSKNRALSRSWNKQGRLNGVASYFSEWQIATHFCFLESNVASGVVARAPLRPEVLKMAQTRKLAHQGQFQPDPQSMPQLEHVKDLLLIESTPELQHEEQREDQQTTTTTLKQKFSIPPTKRRKVVICYFRDRNGGAVVDALLDADFDVLVFDTGYLKDAQSDPNRYGTQYIVDDRTKHRNSLSLRTYEDALVQQRGDTTTGSTANDKNSMQRSPAISLENGRDANSGTERRKLLEDVMNNINYSNEHPRLIQVADRSLFVPLMHVADGVASSAGSQLMSECIHSGMPLLAMYLEHDDEQQMNVELSRRSAYCPTKPQVYGTSFESLNADAGASSDHLRGRSNQNVTRASPTEGDHRRGRSSESDHAWQELGRFAVAVRDSPVSEAFYNYFDMAAKHGGIVPPMKKDATVDATKTADSTTTGGGEKGAEEPFHGLPDAAAIILEILKEVEMAG